METQWRDSNLRWRHVYLESKVWKKKRDCVGVTGNENVVVHNVHVRKGWDLFINYYYCQFPVNIISVPIQFLSTIEYCCQLSGHIQHDLITKANDPSVQHGPRTAGKQPLGLGGGVVFRWGNKHHLYSYWIPDSQSKHKQKGSWTRKGLVLPNKQRSLCLMQIQATKQITNMNNKANLTKYRIIIWDSIESCHSPSSSCPSWN